MPLGDPPPGDPPPGDPPPGDVRPGDLTAVVDCGGSGIKALVLDADGAPVGGRVRVPTPYPLPPTRFLDVVADLLGQLPAAGRVTLGLPGMIRNGVAVAVPHYVNPAGPGTAADPDLVRAWESYDVAAALTARLGLPALVLNDAEVHGAGVIAGRGVELVLTLGTGLGSSLWQDGRLAPHLELSHATQRKGRTVDAFIGEAERRRIGDRRWSRRTVDVIGSWWPVVRWDACHVGGGGARRLRVHDLAALAARDGGPGDTIRIMPNLAGLLGGVRAWDLVEGRVSRTA